LQRDLLERRWRGELSGVAAMRAIGAGYFMAPDQYATALERYLAELAPDATLQARKRLLVLPSEPLSHTHLHQTLEDAGALVVAEDDWYGSRAPGGDVPRTGSALEGIFLKYWTDTATQNVYPSEAREAWFTAHAMRPEVDGVVVYLPPSDHQLGWDYPRLREWLEARCRPHLLVREDASNATARRRIAEQVRSWLEGLR
jgi:benzoyl-CoA reductase/2-hydroxyglutaryl-CoA dehydratase subunit BcrC/BadD/HgdB